MNSVVWRTSLVVCTCLLALGGCKKDEVTKEVKTTTTKEITTTTSGDTDLLAPVVGVDETVDTAWQMRPGKWRTQGTTTVNGQQMTIPEKIFCNKTGQAFTQNTIMSNDIGNDNNCQVTKSRPDVNVLAVKETCDGAQSDMTLTRIDNDHYKQMIRANINGAITETQIDITYLGECDASTPSVQ